MVFKTIVENIRSFIHHEEELLHDPKPIPDTASEVLGSRSPTQKIVERQLPSSSSNIEQQDSTGQKRKPLVSSEQLRSALEKRNNYGSAQRTPSENHESPHVSSSSPTEGALDADVLAFEEAISRIPASDTSNEENSYDSSSHPSFSSSPSHSPSSQSSSPPPLSYSSPSSRSPSSPSSSPPPLSYSPAISKFTQSPSKNPVSQQMVSTNSDPGFFSSFEEFLREDSLNMKHFDGDLLHKMRSFHERQSLGLEPLVHKSSASASLHRRLQELQSLEWEWQRAFLAGKEIDRSLVHLEDEIEEKTTALKTLISESVHLASLAKEVPSDQAFNLADGTSVRSLGALIRVLRNEPWLFDRHVTTDRNDFFLWVRGAFDNVELANRIKLSTNVQELIDALHK